MKFFIDTANIEQIQEVNDLGLLDGVTTNPSLIAKEKKGFRELIEEICGIVDGPVSAEVIAQDCDGMLKEARHVAGWADNIVIKIPMCPEGMKAVKTLTAEGIRTNVTLIFSLPQALIACKAGASFISPFIGRIDDIGYDGMELVGDCVDMINEFCFDSEVISASVRHVQHVVQAIQLGSHIATVPYAPLLKLFKHPLTDIGNSNFLKDWENAGLGDIL